MCIYKLNGHRDGRRFKNLAQPVGSESQRTAVQYVTLTSNAPYLVYDKMEQRESLYCLQSDEEL